MEAAYAKIRVRLLELSASFIIHLIHHHNEAFSIRLLIFELLVVSGRSSEPRWRTQNGASADLGIDSGGTHTRYCL
jgi:hypothetical protein